MKNHLFIFTFLLFPFISFSQTETDSIGFYFETSKNNGIKNPTYEWKDKGEYVTKRIGYWRGSPCGDVAETQRVVGKIQNDTIFINYNIKINPLCNPAIGIASNAIDLVINKKKYPNYKNLIIKEVKIEDCKTDNCFIENIDRIITKPFIIKKEIKVSEDWAGGFENYTIYYDYNEPVLIEVNTKRVVHYRTYQGEKDVPTYIYAKFYIKNWRNNEFIRIGEIKNPIEDVNYDVKDYEIIKMATSYKFEFNRELIESQETNK